MSKSYPVTRNKPGAFIHKKYDQITNDCIKLYVLWVQLPACLIRDDLEDVHFFLLNKLVNNVLRTV
jgi:hypothetical protein